MADRGIAEESLQLCDLELARQYFALREAAQGQRVADGSAKFNTDLECLQAGRIVEDVCINVDGVARVGSGETQPTPAGGPQYGRRQRPAIRRQRDIGRLRACVKRLDHERLQIRCVERRIAFPKSSRFTPVVARLKRLSRFPYTRRHEVVLEIPANAGQMLDDGNADTFQLGLVADTRLHEHLGCMDRTQRQHDLARGPDAMELASAQEFHASYFLLLKRQTRDQCLRQYSQVGAVHVGIDISPEYGLK